MSGWLPYMKAAGTLMQGASANRAGEANAQILKDQSREARDMATRDEEQMRRKARMQYGRQLAATGEAGGDYEGSSGLLLDQSILFSELDALTARYEGDKRARGLLAQSDAVKRQGRERAGAAGLLAGAQLLSEFG